MTEYYDQFNKMYKNFIDTIETFFPSNTVIGCYKDIMTRVIQKDFRIPANMFLIHAGTHATEILNKNDTYFKNILDTDRSYIEKMIIKEWDTMTDDQKNIVWFYLNRLLNIVSNIDIDEDISVNENDFSL